MFENQCQGFEHKDFKPDKLYQRIMEKYNVCVPGTGQGFNTWKIRTFNNIALFSSIGKLAHRTNTNNSNK